MTTPYGAPVWEESKPYWEAARERRFVLQWCDDCGKSIHFPRVACPHCFSENLEWREASGGGTVYACSVVHTKAPKRLRDRSPYVIALVDLDEGARMMTNIVNCEPSSVHVGMRVKVTFEEAGDEHGTVLPVFEPEEAVQ